MSPAFIAAAGNLVSIAVAIGMSVWRAAAAKNVETYGSARSQLSSLSELLRPQPRQWPRTAIGHQLGSRVTGPLPLSSIAGIAILAQIEGR
ncbi:hypothetical protein E4K66_13745 [Bradyrhizobium frederickii]|uniref:Uncharacterized protein n=1 Tax=Bradyrhizobium frederickii TaxID=2560054 RepID=A0A4Y9LAR8_9BRAD|nr:hypothetical protein E4K66_13745 [Bradyrhizobium frederickii]